MKQLSVDFSHLLQSNWLGANGVYHGFSYQPDKEGRVCTEEQLQIEFDRVGAMELSIVRSFYHPSYAWEKGRWDWESPPMEGFYHWLGEMKKRNIQVALQAAWWCPKDVFDPDSPFSPEGTGWLEAVAGYARWISRSLQEIWKRNYENVRYLVLFTEPCNVPNVRIEGRNQWECWADCARAVDAQLKKDNLRDRILLVGPNEGSTDCSPMLEWAVGQVNDCLDIYSSHNYAQNWIQNRDTYEEWVLWMTRGMEKVKKTAKPYWFDEYGLVNWNQAESHHPEELRWTSGLYGLQLAIANAAALNCGVQSTVLWTLFDQQWPNSHNSGRDAFQDGIHKWGIAPTPRESLIPYPCYYAFSLLSRYLGGPGTQVFSTQSQKGLYCAAVKTEKGKYAFLIVHYGSNPIEFQLSLSSSLSRPLYRHLFQSDAVFPDERAAILKSDRTWPKIDGILEDTLPPFSFAVYTTRQD